MTTDYLVASLPTLAFDHPAPLSWAKFLAACEVEEFLLPARWTDLETQLKNTIAEARGGERYKRPAEGCDLYWRNRVSAAFQEKDILKRENLLDQIWWDAAGELTDLTNPLGKGALQTYAIRLKIALKRDKISSTAGNAAFDRLTAETKRESL